MDLPAVSIREDMRQKRAADEARKQGLMAPLIDERGHQINPHMPQFLHNVPFYINQDQKPSLSHQISRSNVFSNIPIQEHYNRGIMAQKVTKYRKGACENCGAMTHKTKDCFERPRRVKAKYTGLDMQGDEVYKQIGHDFESKRDRWAGYDPNTYSEVI